MSQADIEKLFAGLAGVGTTEASGLGFTLESEKAREKLQQFALAQPENYQLLVLAGLYALGCRHFELTIDADDFRVQADTPLDREPFSHLWSFVSRGSDSPTVIGCRLLAMAVLTSVRLDEMEWSLESQDAAGPWRFQAVVRRGLLRESPLQSGDVPIPGVSLWVRRRKLSQIAMRFVARLFGRGRGGFDEALIRRRVVLPRGASLVCNGQPLTPDLPRSERVLASLSTGQAPDLIEAPLAYRLERDYDIAVVLCRPAEEGRGEEGGLPGEDNQAVWVWNGLRMDSTVLGGELDCCRAMVWAPSLHPDLSFSSLVDNRDKQALERNVRSMARELIDRWVREVSPKVAGSEPQFDAFESEREMVRYAVRHRLDPGRDWKRLASLNRALSEFPLLVGSGPDGKVRWISLLEIRRELDAGRAVAAFSATPGGESPPLVPAWHDRPLVLYTSTRERDFLNGRFPSWRLGSAEQVLEQLGKLQRVARPLVDTETVPPLLKGEFTFEGAALRWEIFRLPGAGKRAPAQLQVRRPDGTSFCDSGRRLPPGMRITAKADWMPTFRGELLDQGLANRLEQRLLEELCQAMVEAYSSRPPTTVEAELTGLILGLKGRSWEGRLLALPWLLLSDGDGHPRRCSPAQLKSELEQIEAPLYAMPWTEEVEEGMCGPWREARILRVPRTVVREAERLVGRPVLGAEVMTAALRHVRPRAKAVTSSLWRGELSSAQRSTLGPGIERFEMAIFPARGYATACRLKESVHGYPLPERDSSVGYPGVELMLDWTVGWAGERGERRWREPGDEREAQVLREGCLQLARSFLEQAQPHQVLEADPEGLATMLFDLLSEDSGPTEKLLLTAAGGRVSVEGVVAVDGVARYFSRKEAHPDPEVWADAVYLPGSLRETVEMLTACRWEPVPAKTAAPAPTVSQSPEISSPQRTATTTAPTIARPSQTAKAAPIVSDSPPPVPVPAPPTPPPAESEVVLAPTVPSEVPTIAAQETVLDRAVFRCSLVPSLLEHGTAGDRGDWPHQELFLQFLQGVAEDPEQTAAVSEREGLVTLGRPARHLLGRVHGAAMLLSALYSQFNRLYPEVQDSAEREFHAALLRGQLRQR